MITFCPSVSTASVGTRSSCQRWHQPSP